MTESVTVVDLGLPSDPDERAKELHESSVSFDALFECSWFDGMLTQMKRGGTTAGSPSIGNAWIHRWRGHWGDEITARPEDWRTLDTLVKKIGFLNRENFTRAHR